MSAHMVSSSDNNEKKLAASAPKRFYSLFKKPALIRWAVRSGSEG